jgi:hypothetical protein
VTLIYCNHLIGPHVWKIVSRHTYNKHWNLFLKSGVIEKGMGWVEPKQWVARAGEEGRVGEEKESRAGAGKKGRKTRSSRRKQPERRSLKFKRFSIF